MKQPADIFLDVLKDARLERGVDLDTLADRTGIPVHAIERWERGGQRPRLQSAIRLAQALGYRIELVRVQ